MPDAPPNHRRSHSTDVIVTLLRAASILNDLHSAGSVHGSLSLDKLQVDENGDVSISAAKPSSMHASPDMRARLLPQGYASPEVLSGAQPTPKSDQYSLAAIGLTLLTGRIFSRRANHISIADREIGRRDMRLAEILKTALSPAPENRYASCADFAAQLEMFRITSPTLPSVPVSSNPLSQPKTVLAGLAVLVLAAFLCLWLPTMGKSYSNQSRGSRLPMLRLDRASIPAGGGMLGFAFPANAVPPGTRAVLVDAGTNREISATVRSIGTVKGSIFIPANQNAGARSIRLTLRTSDNGDIQGLAASLVQDANIDIESARRLSGQAKSLLSDVRSTLARYKVTSLTPEQAEKVMAKLYGKSYQAIRLSEEAASSAPGLREAYWGQVQGWYYVGDRRRALEVARDAAPRFPGDPEIKNAVDQLSKAIGD